MKALIQKLPLTEDTSFVARTYRTPDFEVPWHQHIEYEMILFTEGVGMSFIGNYVGTFNTGDIFFLGPNVPHTFQKQDPQRITSAVVIQFREDFWGSALLTLPESREIAKLFQQSLQALKVYGKSAEILGPLIRGLENMKGFKRILRLGECLCLLAEQNEFTPLSTQRIRPLNPKHQKRIDRIFQYTIDSFREPITLSAMAGIACMSVPSFCNYFKASTKKTYIEFLTETRIGYACNLLMDTEMAILDICYESGYNSLANFNKQFLRLKSMTPSQYRRQFQRPL
jgi:AraC-like DNA-binding protein